MWSIFTREDDKRCAAHKQAGYGFPLTSQHGAIIHLGSTHVRGKHALRKPGVFADCPHPEALNAMTHFSSWVSQWSLGVETSSRKRDLTAAGRCHPLIGMQEEKSLLVLGIYRKSAWCMYVYVCVHLCAHVCVGILCETFPKETRHIHVHSPQIVNPQQTKVLIMPKSSMVKPMSLSRLLIGLWVGVTYRNKMTHT